MNIIIAGIHLDITDAIREYATKKASKLSRYFDNIIEIKMNLYVEHTKSEGEVHIADAIVHGNGITLKAESKDKVLYAAIDEVTHILEIQLVKYKEKLKSRQHHLTPAKAMDFSKDKNSDNDQNNQLKISKKKMISSKPMNLLEATLQMKELDKTFYAFRNEDTEELNVVYVTKSGKLGLIEPDWSSK